MLENSTYLSCKNQFFFSDIAIYYFSDIPIPPTLSGSQWFLHLSLSLIILNQVDVIFGLFWWDLIWILVSAIFLAVFQFVVDTVVVPSVKVFFEFRIYLTVMFKLHLNLFIEIWILFQWYYLLQCWEWHHISSCVVKWGMIYVYLVLVLVI